MAADVSVPPATTPNPCCAELKRKYEEVKASLKVAYNLAERQQNVIKEEKLKTKLEKEAKKKEIDSRKILENEISGLKAQIAAHSQETKNLPVPDNCRDELERVKQQLEEEKKRTLSEEMNARNAWSLLQTEKGKVEEEKKLVQNERARANGLIASFEKVKRESGESRDQLARRVEEEKQKANREKKRADSEKAKLEEQKKYTEREKKKAFEERNRADSLLKNLEKEREKAKDLLKNLEEERERNRCLQARLAFQSSQKQKTGVSVGMKDLNVKLLKEKLKLRKAQLKHVKKILKLEKSKNNTIKQELSLLKQDLIQMSSRFKVLDSHLNIGGTNDLAKVFLTLSKPEVLIAATSDHHVFSRQAGAQHKSRKSQSRPVSGTSSESLLPNRQNFAFNSDKKLLVGPQERERDTSVSSPALLPNQKSTETCEKSSLKPLNVNRKRKRKESLDPKKAKIQNESNHLNPELVEFEKVVREGGVLKLLEFENEDLEKRFKAAMEGFLSPNLPQIAPCKKAKVLCRGDIDPLEDKDEDEHFKNSLKIVETVRTDIEKPERSLCSRKNGKYLGGGNEKHNYHFLIVFSNLSKNNMVRYGRLLKEITSEESSVSRTIDLSARVLQLASKSEVLPEDKICGVCSLLASEVCWILMSHSKDVANSYFDNYISTLLEETCSVLSEEMLHYFVENDYLEKLTSLLEDFLIFKHVLVYKKGDLCSTMSTTSQFISSCIMFALICMKTNQLDRIRGTAYKILLNGKSDNSNALIATHIFATICGEKFFGNNRERHFQNALCWVVSSIEKGCTKDLGFKPCHQCPFQLEAAGTATFVDSLLDELEACSLLKNQESHFVCGVHCGNYIAERNGLCYFTDIISLLELVGSYMAWDCAYKKVICRLWKILESCGHEVLASSILVLVGHLSRSVLDEGSYNQIEVSELREKLSNLIQTMDKSGLALQFSCVSALLNLIPLNFNQILLEDDDVSPDKGQFSREICQIRKWFSRLSKEQMGAFQSLLMGQICTEDTVS